MSAASTTDPATCDLDAIAVASAGCTGADIEAAIVTSVLHAAAEKRSLVTADVVQALEDSAPISLLMRERITALRAWARERCRFADEPTDG